MLHHTNGSKSIQNRPPITEDPKDPLLREDQEEIRKLWALIFGQLGTANISVSLCCVTQAAEEELRPKPDRLCFSPTGETSQTKAAAAGSGGGGRRAGQEQRDREQRAKMCCQTNTILSRKKSMQKVTFWASEKERRIMYCLRCEKTQDIRSTHLTRVCNEEQHT
ncbi:kinesin-like protein KIF3B isoform X3 [Scophthalmus maximus]|uniref:kinesin-like protein KIF3B isoform X3 n=1 Tax=Scophthalmus maximus TaxID=52904 RepID=UPI001FA8782B|nr:kinesin-like protein KIF3B isoform X3 [Scophthalmus maximus]